MHHAFRVFTNVWVQFKAMAGCSLSSYTGYSLLASVKLWPHSPCQYKTAHDQKPIWGQRQETVGMWENKEFWCYCADMINLCWPPLNTLKNTENKGDHTKYERSVPTWAKSNRLPSLQWKRTKKKRHSCTALTTPPDKSRSWHLWTHLTEYNAGTAS